MQSRLPRNVLYYGKKEPLPPKRKLHAGPLTLIYESGAIRHIRWRDREVLRGIYVAVRDHSWGTVPLVISEEQVHAQNNTFRITYTGMHTQGDVNFRWQADISGSPRGEIAFCMAGNALSSFRRNRIGFCVLHPIKECAGRACRVERTDGTVQAGCFPDAVSPDCPFRGIRAVSHAISGNFRAEVRFQGDVFEMEDQRNWSDASFKTYCTPLSLPYPVLIQEGARVSQSVTLTLQGDPPHHSAAFTQPALTFSPAAAPTRSVPRIGLCMAGHGESLSSKQVRLLKALHLSHLRVDLVFGGGESFAVLKRAAMESSRLGIPLLAALVLSDDAEKELIRLIEWVQLLKPRIRAWLVFHEKELTTSGRWISLAREKLTVLEPTAQIGSGTNAFFCQLNREHPPVELLDFVSFSLNPQVHAFDNTSLVETLEALPAMVESARRFIGNAPLCISPVTFKMRFRPDATGPGESPNSGELPEHVDVRQMSLFGAAWTAASLKYLGERGVQSCTYFETTGWSGVMERESGSLLPRKFLSVAGSVFPVYHALADIGEFADGKVIPTTSSDPLEVDGIAVQMENRTRVIVCNMTDSPKRVSVRNLKRKVTVRTMDERNVDRAMLEPEGFRAAAGTPRTTAEGTLDIELLPYAVCRIDDTAAPHREQSS